MFREMTRKNQQLSQEECTTLLASIPRGVLSLHGDDGYPYGVPTNFWYCQEDGCIYFHSGQQGHKIDALSRNPKASLGVMDQGSRKENDWALSFKSVIVFGLVEKMERNDRTMEIVRRLSQQFTQDDAYIEKEIELYGKRTLFFRLVPQHMTGKQVHEA